jgi:hypothetical protein
MTEAGGARLAATSGLEIAPVFAIGPRAIAFR